MGGIYWQLAARENGMQEQILGRRRTGMLRSTPRPAWGWTATARAWLSILGAVAALGLILSDVSSPPEAPPAPAPRMVVDPNTAPAEVLGALPKLGPALVGRIVAERDRVPFRSIDE